jgi:hypothetical protein
VMAKSARDKPAAQAFCAWLTEEVGRVKWE